MVVINVDKISYVFIV
jgi:hypothetical protein